jgi:hypothetical protein
MPPKRKPVKKPKQKQKQKQVVKQSVRVNVQSSGGSGAGGTSGPLPMQFRDTSGENQRLMSLVEQIARSRAPIQQAIPDPVRIAVPVRVPEAVAERYNPANDEATVNDVFNAPINTNKPSQLGPASESEGEAVVRRRRTEAEKQRRRELDAARKAAREEQIRQQAISEAPWIIGMGEGMGGDEETIRFATPMPKKSGGASKQGGAP